MKRMVLVFAVLGTVNAGTIAAFGEDDFPIAGTYMQNENCKGDGSDPVELRVQITPKDINSSMGLCLILDRKREGETIKARIECNGAAGVIMGDVSFTMQPDKSLQFEDKDSTYTATLHKCPE